MRVAYNSLLPPFSEQRDGQPAGLVVDIFRAVADHAGLEAEFVAMPLERMEASLAGGEADVALPVAMTAERLLKLDFTETLLMTGGSLFVRPSAPSPASLDELKGEIVVTPRTGPLAPFIQKTAPEVMLRVTEDYETSLSMVAGGEAVAAALNHQTGAILAQRLHPGRIKVPTAMFLELPFGAAVLKGHQVELVSSLNKALAAVRADGTWYRINARWLAA